MSQWLKNVNILSGLISYVYFQFFPFLKSFIFEKNKKVMGKRSHDEQIAEMSFASVYPHYLAKVEKQAAAVRNYIQ